MKKVVLIFVAVLALVVGVIWNANQKDSTSQDSTADQIAVTDDETALRTRAKARWDAIAAADYQAAYAFETPAYRAVNDLTTFMTRFAGQVARNEVQIEKVELTSDILAKVTIKLDFSVLAFGSVMESVSYDVETWAKLDGTWWHLPKN